MVETPKGWNERRLIDVADYQNGHAFYKDGYSDSGMIAFDLYNVSEDGGLRFGERDKFVSKELCQKYARFILNQGDLVMVLTDMTQRLGILGKCTFIDRDATYILNQRMARIVPNTNVVVPVYLKHYINSPQFLLPLHALAKGTAQKYVNTGDVKSNRLLVPPLPIQRKIAAILSAYDDLIENNTRRIAILEEMAQAIYREWFVNFRFPGHENVKLVDSPLGQIPEGWSTSSIDDACSRITDGSHRSPKSVDDGLPMASMKDMENWRLNLSTTRKITPDDFEQLVRSDCKPMKGDVLIAKDGANYLKYIFVVEEEQEVVLLSSVAILRPNGTLHPHLMAITLNDPQTKGKLANYVTGAAIPRVILKDFKRFEIMVPPAIVQHHWWECVEPIIQLIHGLLKKNDNLRTTRDLLLPKLISGKLDVEDLDIDVGEPIESLEEATA